MKKSRALFLINTPYQLMITVSLRNNEFKDTVADVIITDNIAEHKILCDRLRKTNIFEHVYEIGVKNVFVDNKLIAIKNRFCGVKEKFAYVYDYFLFANLDHSVSAIYGKLKKSNSNINVFMFEDGLATYSDWYTEFLSMYGAKAKSGKIYKHGLAKKVFHFVVDDVFKKVKRIYLLSPDIISYSPNFEIIQMKSIAYKNPDIVGLYNRIFGYDASVDAYKQKVIFFEESYYADGIESHDIELVEQIAAKVGKENIIIKIHPRNPKNRFKELGYLTNKNLSIPWEVIAMNLDLTDKILISIASVAVIEPRIMLAQKYMGILLMDLVTDSSFLKKNITNLYEKICLNNRETIKIIGNMEELRNIL